MSNDFTDLSPQFQLHIPGHTRSIFLRHAVIPGERSTDSSLGTLVVLMFTKEIISRIY